MYAVIKTGGKQYRVQAGDLLIVEKLEGEPGAAVAFDQVLMIGEGAAVTLGEPTVAAANVKATLVETRKGEKIKVFKKIRRQGYRRTRGHRQYQSVLRVTSIAGDGKSETWNGTVDLTPLATLNARARNLARGMEAAQARRSADETAKVAKPAAPARTKAAKTTAKPAPPAKAKAKTKTEPAPAKAPKIAAPAKSEAKAATPARAGAKAASGKMKAPKAAAPAKVTPAKAPAKVTPAKKAAAKPAPANLVAEKPAAKKAAAKKPAKAAKPTGKKGK